MTEPERKQDPGERFAALWHEFEERQERPRKGLNLSDIVEAAVQIADEKGLADVSMARVAKRLGYSTMALYRHVPNKGELLALMFDAGVGEPPAHTLEISGWRERMHAYSREFSSIFRDRPWLIDIPISGPPIGPNNISMLNLVLTALEDTGLAIRDRLEVFMVLTNYLLGSQRVEVEVIRTGEAAQLAGFAVDDASYGQILRSFVPPGRFPAVDEAVASGVFGDEDGEDQMRREVDHILDGIEALMIRRGVMKASSATWASEGEDDQRG